MMIGSWTFRKLKLWYKYLDHMVTHETVEIMQHRKLNCIATLKVARDNGRIVG